MSRNALVVGINSYRHLNPLSAPAEDAEAIAKRLEEYGDFRVQRFPEIITDDEMSGKPQVSDKIYGYSRPH